MKKKQQKKVFKDIKKANSDCWQAINVVIDNHEESLSKDEKKALLDVADHLLNMNVLFSNIEEGFKTNANKVV